MKYAAYGSNLHPSRLSERTGEADLLGTARIDNLALRFHKRGNLDGSGKCNIIEEADGHVFVAVFEIPDEAIGALDAAEGAGNGYQRRDLDVDGFGRCLTYRAQQSHIDETLSPFTWYKQLVLAGCRAHCFPDAYIAAIESVESVDDPDPERHALHVRLLGSL